MKVLAIVQVWNVNDPIRGFIVPWVEKFSERVDEVIVLTLEQRHSTTHPKIKVFSLGKEHSRGLGRRRHWLRYLLCWHRHISFILAAYHPDVIFTHMTPMFSVLVAPYAKLRRIPIVTWFAHRQITMTLRLAHHLSDSIVSINKASYPYKHDRLTTVGHGIDIGLFSPSSTPIDNPPLLLSVGRISPIKNLVTLLEATYLLRQRGYNVRCVLVGSPPERDIAYAKEVNHKVQALNLEESLQFVGSLPNHQLTQWYRRSLAHVNCCPTDGALDKAVLEAMACGKPSLSSTVGFTETMGKWADRLLFQHGDPEDLAGKIEWLMRVSDAERQAMGMYLRESVMKRHDLEQLSSQLVSLYNDLIDKKNTYHGGMKGTSRAQDDVKPRNGQARVVKGASLRNGGSII